jgi:hypothetical protein
MTRHVLLPLLALGACGCAAAEVPATPPVASGPPIDAGPGIVRVHIESPDPELTLKGYGAAKLQAEPDGRFLSFGPLEPLCQAPCDSYVDAREDRALEVVGPHTPSSSPFRLSDAQGEVQVTVEPGSKALLVTGMVATILGGAGALGGGGVLAIGMVTRSGDVGSRPQDLMVGGGVTLGASAAVVAVGLLMRYFGSTFVAIEPGAAAGSSASAEGLGWRW